MFVSYQSYTSLIVFFFLISHIRLEGLKMRLCFALETIQRSLSLTRLL